MPRRKWTDEDRQFLKDNYKKMTNKELGEHFGMTATAIHYKLKTLGLKRSSGRWTEEMDHFLRSNYMRMTSAELASYLGRTTVATQVRVNSLKLRRLKKWTPEREQFLQENYEEMSNALLAKKLATTELAIAKKMSRMGLARKPERKWSRWTPERKQFLRDNFEVMSNTLLAKKLGTTESAVAVKMSYMGLVRKPRWKWSRKKENFLRANYKRLSIYELADACDMPSDYIRNKIAELGLR